MRSQWVPGRLLLHYSKKACMGTRLETHVTIEGTSGKEKVDGGGGSREDIEEDDRKKE